MARLPKPGGDVGNWGQILNQYLSVEHAADGTLRPDGSLAGKVDASDLADVATTGKYGDLQDIPASFAPSPHNHDDTYVKPADLGTAAVEDATDFAPALYAKGVIIHNTDTTVARPTGYASVEWIGSVEPTNMANGDTWLVLP